MSAKEPNLEGFEQMLETLANDPRLPVNYRDWVRSMIGSSGGRIQVMRYILNAPAPDGHRRRVMDLGAQTGALSMYAARLGCEAAAVDLPMYAEAFGKIAADHGADYRQCDVTSQPLPFADDSFDFIVYTDVIEHHSFSPKRVLKEIHRVLAPRGRLILTTPNHASIYNRLMLPMGKSVNDDFEYFFSTCADLPVYPGHHREYTRSEVRAALEATGFRVLECSVREEGDLTSIIYYLRRRGSRGEIFRQSRSLMVGALGKIWTALHLPFGRWIWAVGEKSAD